jgi:hypothetical protein
MRLFRLPVLILCCVLLATAPAAERQITPEQRDRLFRSVEEITKFISSDLKIPANVKVKCELVSMEQLRTTAQAQSADPKTQDERLRTEAVLRKIGFIPRDYDTGAFRKAAGSDIILGLYKPAAKTLYVLDTLEVGQQGAVLAHELMHAIQDQNVNVREYLSARSLDAPPLNDADEDIYDPTYDDGALARRAVIEGEGMVAMYEYVLEQARSRVKFAGQSERNEIRAAMDAAFPHPKKNPVIQDAPLYLRESTTFPYEAGFKFIWELKDKQGPTVVAKLLKDPPRSTQEVLFPPRYLHHRIDEQPFRAPKMAHLVAPSYVPIQVTSMGEFDVDIFLRQYAGVGKANRIAPKWNGGVVFAARKADVTVDKLNGADVGMAYVSLWQDEDAAKRFAEAWAASVPKRYAGAKVNGRSFQTSEGPVVVEQHGETVLVVESFPAEMSAKIRDAVFDVRQTAAGAN